VKNGQKTGRSELSDRTFPRKFTVVHTFRIDFISERTDRTRETMKKPYRKPLSEEIADAESKNQHESVLLKVTVPRSLYLHALYAVRDGDYGGLSAYISDLLRQVKKGKTT
jgi:hypothetical protein